MTLKLYTQMDTIIIHAENKCGLILTPESNFSPQLQFWNDRIYAYLALLGLKEGNHRHANQANIYCHVRRKHIDSPNSLTKQDIKDTLRICRIRQHDLKYKKGRRKVHQRDCLIEAQGTHKVERA
jgi:hypothetical protein